MYLVHLRAAYLDRLCRRAIETPEGRANARRMSSHARLASQLATWLNHTSATLIERGYCFEAESALTMAEQLREFAHEDGSAGGFASQWTDLQDWAETLVTTPSGYERTLCNLPQLPDDFAC